MAITKSKITRYRELTEQLKKVKLKKSLTHFHDNTSPNYKLLYDCVNGQKWGLDEKGKPKLLEGYVGAILEGSSRSTKTWSGVFLIIYLCTIRHEKDGCTINIYRETYNEFKTTLYEDFSRVLDMFGLPNKFKNADEVKSFRIGNSKINFLGDGKHGGGCDYAFFNEVMMQNYQVYDQVTMRCRIFWWMDYNPSFTDHWVFDKVEKRPDVAFLRTTYLDNPYIKPQEYIKITGYEPYLPGSYEIVDDDLYYNGNPITDKNQPPPHPENVPNGTSDPFMWKCYGLGLRGAMEGVIFPHVTWIDEFPDIDYTYGNDFGFTADPNALVKYAEDESNIYVELLCYQPIETANELSSFMDTIDVDRLKPITCDSSDKYTGENKGTVEMVKELKELGWLASKVSKKKSVMYWLLSMKQKKLHVVKNNLWQHVKTERQNYIFKTVNGIQINQPIDKFNHFWDATRYCHMSHNETDYYLVGF